MYLTGIPRAKKSNADAGFEPSTYRPKSSCFNELPPSQLTVSTMVGPQMVATDLRIISNPLSDCHLIFTSFSFSDNAGMRQNRCLLFR